MDFNIVLNKVGEYGTYQKLLLWVFLLSSSFFYTLVFYCQLFLLIEPPHICASNNMSLPFPENADLSCREYIPIYNGTEIQAWNSSKCTSGWVYDYSLYFSTIVSEQNWICEDNNIPYQVQSFYYFGMLAGTLIFGSISDQYGRKPPIFIGCAMCIVAGCLSTWYVNYYLFIICRTICGASSMPLLGDCYILSIEYVGTKHRTDSLLILAIGFSLFPAAYPFIPKYIRNWRWMCIASSLPLSLYFMFSKCIPESACWLITQGRTEEATKELNTVAKINRKESITETMLLIPIETTIDENEKVLCVSTKVPLSALFGTPRMRKHTILLIFIWLMTITCYNVTIQDTSKLGTDVYKSFMYGGLIELPSVIWMYFSVDTIGRRWTMIISSLVAGLVGFFSLAYRRDTEYALLGIALIQRVALTSQYSTVSQYVAELYPTVIRSRASSFLNLVGTAVVIISPYCLFLMLPWPFLPLFLCGLLSSSICIMVFFLPETLNHELPHTIEEGELFGIGQKKFHFPCLSKNDDEDDYRDHALDDSSKRLHKYSKFSEFNGQSNSHI